MRYFISYACQLETLLSTIVSSPFLHAKWLNTLSYMENCGARKIAACEHPTLVKEEMLKHAAEEFRHAHYLKKQIERICSNPIDTYSRETILGGMASLHYLGQLDIKTSHYLRKRVGLSGKDIKGAAYLLVTYAIERRAQELYPLYEKILRAKGSSVKVKSIVLEEEEHLNEMERGLMEMAGGKEHAEQICQIESELCGKWVSQIERQISGHLG